MALASFALLGISLVLIFGNSTNATSIIGTIAVGLIKLLRACQQIYFTLTSIKSRKDTVSSVLSYLKQKVDSSSFVRETKELEFNSSIRLKNVGFSYGKYQPLILKNIKSNIKVYI